MSRHFFQYWKPQQVALERRSSDPLVDHSGGEQLRKVNPGDTVWIVTVIKGTLLLLAKIPVAERTNFADAVRRLGTKNLWKATQHIIANRKTAEPYREVDLTEIAAHLRFISPTNKTRLKIVGGYVDGKQLQAMRQLTSESVSLLEKMWSGSRLFIEFEKNVKRGAGFGDSETNRKVERAAISFVASWYESRGWKVTKVELEKRGYDLLCSKAKREEHVEVKGVQGQDPSFIITSGEVRQAQTNPHFFICIVTSVLTNKPQMSRYSGAGFNKKFKLSPLAYKASMIIK